jgi:mono/diheme cytochrome c family protein
MLLGCMGLFAVGCDMRLPGKPIPKDASTSPEQQLSFDLLFNRNCAGCHGRDGKQGPAPPLNDPIFRAIVPIEELEMAVTGGRVVDADRQPPLKTPMPAFAQSHGGPLTEAQIKVLVSDIKGLDSNGKAISNRWGKIDPAPPSTPAYSLPDKEGDAKKGAQLFAIACASCHGDNGVGVDSDGRRRHKINDVAFLSLISDQELRRIMITGRPDLKMPNFAEKTERPADFQPLTSAQIADLNALLSAWRKGQSVPSKQP